jgi:hypothetical protein
MSVEVSPPFVIPAPPRAEAKGIKARRHAPPPPPSTTRLDAALNRVVVSPSLWLTPILLIQAILSLRLSNGLHEDEALAINSGHQMIGHLLHGTPTPAFGHYFGGVPALYAVPAAMLDHVGGPGLVRGVNTLLVLLATVLLYLSARRIFGQGPALVAAGVFAVNPTTIFVARFASIDGPALLLLAAAFYLSLRAYERRRYAVAAGALLATAVAVKYVVVLFVPGVLLAATAVTALRLGGRLAWRASAATAAVMVATAGGWALVAHRDWSGFAATALGGHPVSELASAALWRDGWDYLGVIAIASLAAVWVLRGRRPVVGVLCASGLSPVVVQISSQESASLQRNIGLAMVFLAPVLGALGAWLIQPGRLLGARAPLALVGAVALLSSGMGTSLRMMHGWPTATSIDSALRYYAHDGSARYLVDGSSLPAYYLSDVTSYEQWASTLDTRYATGGGAERLREDLQSGAYRLVLYRDDGATPALDRSMIPTLRSRYTLVARVPVSPEDHDAYWSLWLSELPR